MINFLTKQIEIIKKLIALYSQLLRLKKNEEMVRRICSQKGLSQDGTNLICKVIHCESGFDDRAILVNKDGSRDLGIIQANSFWYISKMKLLTEWEALYDPEKCVRVMIQRYKEGFIKDWVCYSTKNYKNFSGKV